MKITNRIICFLSVLVLCVPLLFSFQSVSAAETNEPISKGYLVGDIKKFVSDNYPLSDKNGISFDNKIMGYSYNGSYLNFSVYDTIPFLAICIKGYSDEQTIYFISYNTGDIYSDEITTVIYYSLSPIYLSSSDSKKFYFSSDSGVYKGKLHFTKKLVSVDSILSSSLDYYNIDDNSYLTLNENTSKTTFKTMINGSGDSNFPDFLPNADRSNITNFSDIFMPFEQRIEIKVTPQLTYDIQGIDATTKNSNSFKLEITNNSDTNIQWTASIYNSSDIISDGKYRDFIWKYICRETYYSSRKEENNSFFKDHATHYGILKTGSFDEHLLCPGQTFTDTIYWENIKLSPNVSYAFVVSVTKTSLSHATSLIWKCEDTDELRVEERYDKSYHDSCLNLDIKTQFDSFHQTFFDTQFSLISVPAFSSVVRSGNSISNVGNITDFRNNYESQSNFDGTGTNINKNYKDPVFIMQNYNRPDVDLSLDNFSIDDVKSYITSCQSFFILIKECLMSFPAFIWALICFGITGLIVIGIVKALL